jgi:glycogen synthase
MPSADRVRRVLMTTDGVGGVWPYSLDLSTALARHGIGVDLVALGPALREAQRRDATSIPNVRLHEVPGKLEWMDDPWNDLAMIGEWLLTREARLRPDVVHLNGYAHAALPWRSPRLVVAHSCVLSWWAAVHDCDAPECWTRYADAVARGLQAAEVVVAPTRAMADCVVRHYGPPRDLRVIANGRRGDPFAPAPRKESIVFAAGRLWDEAKNIQALCAVAPSLAWPVVLAGDDRGPDGRRATWGSVLHLGALQGSQLCAMFARAAIYALPARYEPFGLSPLEAGLSGCALVLGDIRSLREVWDDAAMFVPPDNRRALAAAIERLIRDEAFRRDMAARARSRARRFTANAMADGYADLYRELRGERVAA